MVSFIFMVELWWIREKEHSSSSIDCHEEYNNNASAMDCDRYKLARTRTHMRNGRGRNKNEQKKTQIS